MSQSELNDIDRYNERGGQKHQRSKIEEKIQTLTTGEDQHKYEIPEY